MGATTIKNAVPEPITAENRVALKTGGKIRTLFENGLTLKTGMNAYGTVTYGIVAFRTLDENGKWILKFGRGALKPQIDNQPAWEVTAGRMETVDADNMDAFINMLYDVGVGNYGVGGGEPHDDE